MDEDCNGYIHDKKISSKKTGHIFSFQNMEYLWQGKKADSGGKDHPGRFRVASVASVIRVVLPRMVVPDRFNIFWFMNLLKHTGTPGRLDISWKPNPLKNHNNRQKRKKKQENAPSEGVVSSWI